MIKNKAIRRLHKRANFTNRYGEGPSMGRRLALLGFTLPNLREWRGLQQLAGRVLPEQAQIPEWPR